MSIAVSKSIPTPTPNVVHSGRGRKSPSTRRVFTWLRALIVTATILVVFVAPPSPSSWSAPGTTTLPDGHVSDLTMHSQLGGQRFSIAATEDALGQRLFLGIGARIEVYDVEDIAAPVRIGSTKPLPSYVQELQIEGPLLYAHVYRGGLHVFDIGSAVVPRLIGSFTGVSGSVPSFGVSDGFAFLADRLSGILVFDVNTPSEPRLVSTVELRAASESETILELHFLFRKGNELAVVGTDTDESSTHELIIFDIEDPASVRELGRVRFSASNPRMFVWLENLVYVGGETGIHVVDVADSSAPRSVGDVARPDGMLHVGGALYSDGRGLYQWANDADGTALLEYSREDPVEPRLVAVHRNGPWGGVYFDKDRLYAYSNVDALVAIYENLESEAPEKRGVIELTGFMFDAVGDESTVWFMGRRGLYTQSATSPEEAPTFLPTDWGAYRIALEGGRLYFAAIGDGLRSVDVSDPSSPRELEPIPLVSPAVALRNVAAQGDRAYALAYRGSRVPSDLWILDTTRSEGPSLLGTLPMDIGWNGLAQFLPLGDFLLISSDSGPSSREIIVVDVSDATAPHEVHRKRLPGHVWDLEDGGEGTVYAAIDGSIVTYKFDDEPVSLVERSRWTAGDEGAKHGVFGIGLSEDRVYAVVSFPIENGGITTAHDSEGYSATLASFIITPSGRLERRGETPMAAALGSNSSYRPFVSGPFVWVVNAAFGMNVLRHESDFDLGHSTLLPFVSRDK